MDSMEKFCLNAFEENIRGYFGTLRKDKRLFDVTLVTDDGQHIQAHMVILSACSQFFHDIFMKSKYTHTHNMLIYLKGISSENLEPVLDFIYNGERSISQEKLKVFIETGKELQVNGVEDILALTGVQENIFEDEYICQDSSTWEEKGVVANHNIAIDEEPSIVHTEVEDGHIVVKTEEENTPKTKNDLNLQINKMIEKSKGLWNCKVCGKTSSRISNIKDHAERHIAGTSYTCNICNKTFPNRPSLKNHDAKIHSELISCDICGKSGMNKIASWYHKRREHNL